MNVAVIGAGITKFGEFWEASYRDLITEAGVNAIRNAGIDGIEVDALYVGSMTPGLFIEQEHIGALVSDNSGLMGIPATRVESACASGGVALRQAFLAIKAGVADVVVAGGISAPVISKTSHAFQRPLVVPQQLGLSQGHASDPAVLIVVADGTMEVVGTSLNPVRRE